MTYSYSTDDNKRRGSNAGLSAHYKYNWDAGWNVVNEEDNCGSLTVTYVHDPGNSEKQILRLRSG